MLELSSVSKNYTMGEVNICAVNQVSFSLKQGTFLSIVGKSGSGKSSLLHLIGGLDDVSSGTISVDGTIISAMKEKQLSDFRRKNIGFVFQFFNLIPELSSEDNILLAQQLSKVNFDKNYYQKLITLLELQKRMTHLPSQLSGGERQRVAIARALITKPKLLLLDEPTGNLDSNSSLVVVDMIKSLKQELGQTVIMVTHDNESAKKADRLITLKNGSIESDFIL